MTTKRTGNISHEQKETLVDFLEQHDALKNGKFNNNFTFKDAQKLWEEITETLNSIPGAKKDWRHWRKTWQDLRTKIKSKQSSMRKHMLKTGGGEIIKDHLNPIEQYKIKNNIKEKYYKAKLEFMQEDINTKKRIACALETIAEALKTYD